VVGGALVFFLTFAFVGELRLRSSVSFTDVVSGVTEGFVEVPIDPVPQPEPGVADCTLPKPEVAALITRALKPGMQLRTIAAAGPPSQPRKYIAGQIERPGGRVIVAVWREHNDGTVRGVGRPAARVARLPSGRTQPSDRWAPLVRRCLRHNR